MTLATMSKPSAPTLAARLAQRSRQPTRSWLKLSCLSLACISIVIVFNVKEMVLLDGTSKLPWPFDSMVRSGAPSNRPAYFLRPKRYFIRLPDRDQRVQTNLVKPGDFIYNLKPENWDAAPIVIPSHRLVFFTVPKVGCTVWKQLFRRMMGQEDWQSQDATLGLPHNPQTNQLLYLYNFSLDEASTMMTSPEWTRAIMVREPKQRFLSAFLDKAVSNDHQYIYSRCCPKHHALLEAKYCQDAEYSAAGFLRLAGMCDDQHWTPQHRRVDFKYWPYMDYVLHAETAAEDAKALLQGVGSWNEAEQTWTSAWDRYGRSGWGKYMNSSIFESQSPEAAGEHVTLSQFQHWKWLTPQIEMKVERFYQSDYENPLFNYTRGICWTCT